MRQTMEQMTARIAGLAALMLLAVTPAMAERSISESVDAGRKPQVQVENIAGSITVTGGSGSMVEVTGTIGDDVEELRVEQRGNKISISVEMPDDTDERDLELSADLVIQVPQGSDLEIEAVSAHVAVADVQGEVSIEAVSGKVELGGDLGAVSVEAVSGKVVLAAGSRLAEGEFESVSGNILCEADLADGGRFSFETVSGNISVSAAAGFGAEWAVESFSGSIDNAIGPEAQRTSKYAPGKELNFTSGNGAAQVSIETLSGRINIRDN